MSLSSVISDVGPNQPLLLVQSSAAQSSLALFRQILTNNINAGQTKYTRHLLLFSLVHPPSSLIADALPSPSNLEVHDWTHIVPGYEADWSDLSVRILSIVKAAPPGPIHVAIDSIDTLMSDVGSVSETYRFLHELFELIRSRPTPSRLILHALRTSELVPLLIQPSFSPSLTSLIAHPPVILTHLAKEYLTPPPPVSPPTKFWSAFLPLSEREHDVNQLVFGADGEGSGSADELVVEILARATDGPGRRRGVERVLEGWRLSEGACDLMRLENIRPISTRTLIEATAPDPTQHAFFNLSLTPSQQESRAHVPLPYAHQGNSNGKQTIGSGIFYDPDSADDLDDDDPDEDLDI